MSAGRVAIVGAALRVPGAGSLDGYWDNLTAGRDCLTRRTDAVPDYAAHPLGLPAGARFVAAYGRIEGAMAFDNARFGISAAEALATDPQQRLLLELADRALHVAAIPASLREGAAVFVGCGPNAYDAALRESFAGVAGVDDLTVELGTARDYAAGKIAYRLGTRGPTVNVLAACSTALAAIHLGCRALLDGECDLAIAGAAAVAFPERDGYWAMPGNISATDGVCRPFDARAGGTVPADGAGVLLLRRLGDAIAEGDDILAVIRGSAMANDGRKPGFAHVSATAQERVIRNALRRADVDGSAIRYLEAHGTATPLGDAVEWAALHAVFGGAAEPVLVGSVKGNIGHTRECAGLAGLLKAVLCLRHGAVPATANFASLPGDLGAPCTPLRPVARLTPLDARARLAGVSAFGLGGTNCHVVLEAAPVRHPAPGGGCGTILVSSHAHDTLDADMAALEVRLQQDPGLVAGFAARSQRRDHQGRRLRCVLSLSGAERNLLRSPMRNSRGGRPERLRAPRLAFAFPGVGSERRGMGGSLARRYPDFARCRDEIASIAGELGVPVAGLLAGAEDKEAPVGDLRRLFGRAVPEPQALPGNIAVAHLALYAVQLATAGLLAAAGIRASAVIGHSVGEIAAATVAGAVSKSDAVRLILRRACAMQEAGPGATLAIGAEAERVTGWLDDGLALTADNSARSCAVAGPTGAVDALEARLVRQGVVCRRLPSQGLFHHPRLGGAAHDVEAASRELAWRDPAIPMVSGMTGQWIGKSEIGPGYWSRHLLEPVRFRHALATLAAEVDAVVEVGPGNIRPWLVQAGHGCDAIRTFPLGFEAADEVATFEQALADLWRRGHDPIWPAPASKSGWLPADEPPVLLPRIFSPGAGPCLAEAVPGSSGIGEWACPPPRVPAGAVADDLVAWWRVLLGTQELEGDDDFFELGGDSLLGRHLIAMVRDRYAVEVPGAVVFASSRLSGMIDAIRCWIENHGDRHG